MENNELITKAQVKHLILQNSEDIDVDQAWRMLSDIKSVGTYEELEAYRTAEQDGTLLRLPCKVGDIIYDIRGDWETGEPMLIPHRVEAIYPTIRENGEFGFNLYATDFGFSITEKTNMYYSYEAAKAALKEQGSNNESI